MRVLSLLPAAALLSLALSSCNQPIQTVTGGARVSVGVAVDDSASSVTATKRVTPATDTSPATVAWAVNAPGNVTFTFSTRPGSDAVYITGYRMVSDRFDGLDSGAREPVSKLNMYVGSGYICAERTAVKSCSPTNGPMEPANGLTSAPLVLNFSAALAPMVIANNASVTRETAIEFLGQSSNGQAVTIPVSGVVSYGIKDGDL